MWITIEKKNYHNRIMSLKIEILFRYFKSNFNKNLNTWGFKDPFCFNVLVNF